jgi:hypothetical protein
MCNRLIQRQQLDLFGPITLDMAMDGFTRTKAGTKAGANYQQPAQTAGFYWLKITNYEVLFK